MKLNKLIDEVNAVSVLKYCVDTQSIKMRGVVQERTQERVQLQEQKHEQEKMQEDGQMQQQGASKTVESDLEKLLEERKQIFAESLKQIGSDLFEVSRELAVAKLYKPVGNEASATERIMLLERTIIELRQEQRKTRIESWKEVWKDMWRLSRN